MCPIVSNKNMCYHSGLNGMTIWKGPGCKDLNVCHCYIVLKFLSCIIPFVRIECV